MNENTKSSEFFILNFNALNVRKLADDISLCSLCKYWKQILLIDLVFGRLTAVLSTILFYSELLKLNPHILEEFT